MSPLEALEWVGVGSALVASPMALIVGAARSWLALARLWRLDAQQAAEWARSEETYFVNLEARRKQIAAAPEPPTHRQRQAYMDAARALAPDTAETDPQKRMVRTEDGKWATYADVSYRRAYGRTSR